MRWFLSLFLLAFAACGSGTGGASGTDPFAAHDALTATVTALGVTPVDQLPTTGQAGYAGTAVLNLPVNGTTVAYIADLSVTVVFDAGDTSVDGALGGFQSAANGDLTGTLAISDGVFDPTADPDTDYQVTATLGGSLSGSGANYTINGTVAGDFRGPEGTAMAGVIFGDISSAGLVDIFDGNFAATQP